MSIYKGNKKVVALYKGATPIIRRYKGTQLIFDATPSDEPIITDTLSFAWSGSSTSQTFKINNITKTATTNPYSATLTVLGVDKFTNAYQMFYQKSAVTAITSIPDTTDVTNMSYMFRGCGALTSLDVTKTFNTSNVTNMSYMFSYCYKLKTLDLSSFDTSKVTNMNMMFYNSTALTEVNLSGWDLRNVTSKASMFGNGVKPTKVIMNGCDCDTILFIRQEMRNNGVDHTKVVQTDTVCPTYETSTKITYNILKPSDNCAYNEYIYPSSVIENTNKKDEYGVTSNTSNYITNYTVKFQLQEGGASVEGDNETGKERVIVGIVYYNDEYIGEYLFKQAAKPTDSGGGSNSLSCNFDKSTQITDLYFDMDNLPEEMGYWWVGFSFNPNQEGDCNNCNWSNGDLSICLYENRYQGIMNGQITDLEQVNGLYHLHLDTPLYFKCGEANSHLERYYLTPDKSASCGTISFRWDGNATDSFEFELQLMTRNVYREDCEDNGDGTYTYTTTLSDMGIETLTNCNWAFSHSRYLVELNDFPCTDNVIEMRNMFSSSEVSNLDLSSFNVSNVNAMTNMFYNCRNLTSLNLNGWKLNDNVDTENMFRYCDRLNEIYLKNSDDTTYMKIQNALIQSGIDTQILITK